MKKKSLILSVICLCLVTTVSIFFGGCGKNVEYANTDKDLRSTLQQDLQKEFAGRTFVKVTSNNEVLIAQSTGNNDTIDRIFMLTVDTKRTIGLKDGDLGLSSVFFYKDQRAIAVHSNKTNEIYFLGLDEQASQNKVNSLAHNKNLNGLIRENLLGYGLSMIKGIWDKNTLNNLTKKYAASLIVLSDLQKKYSPTQKIAAANDDIPIRCFSGGTGSTGCTFTSPIVGSSCSVTCATGYFACCNAVTCNCTPNGQQPTAGGQPRFGQCGGSGWTGPNYCQSPYTCVYINASYSQCE